MRKLILSLSLILAATLHGQGWIFVGDSGGASPSLTWTGWSSWTEVPGVSTDTLTIVPDRSYAAGETVVIGAFCSVNTRIFVSASDNSGGGNSWSLAVEKQGSTGTDATYLIYSTLSGPLDAGDVVSIVFDASIYQNFAWAMGSLQNSSGLDVAASAGTTYGPSITSTATAGNDGVAVVLATVQVDTSISNETWTNEVTSVFSSTFKKHYLGNQATSAGSETVSAGLGDTTNWHVIWANFY